MNDTLISSVAEKLIEARKEAKVINSDDVTASLSFDQAYDVQAEVIRLNQAAVNPVIGWKAAMSNQAAMSRFDLEKPVFAPLFRDMFLADDVLRKENAVAPKVEVELAFILGKDIVPAVNDEDILAAIESICPAFEVADCRISDWKFNISAFIADNAAAGFIRLGKPVTLSSVSDFNNIPCTLHVNGEEYHEVPGNIIGGSLLSFVGIVRHVLNHHGGLNKGDVIMSGSLTLPLNMKPGSVYHLNMIEQDLYLSYQ